MLPEAQEIHQMRSTNGQQMLGAACRSTSLSSSYSESELRWVLLVNTVLCVCPGAQQLLRETLSAEQSTDVFAVGANQSI